MKTEIIYTILFAACALFCRAFGAGNAEPIWDTTICVQKGDTVAMYKYEEQIRQLLETKEKAIWGGCCDIVSVELKGVPTLYPDDIDGRQIRNVNDWPAVIIKGTSTFSLEVTYIRRLMCTDIPQSEAAAKPGAPLAMWNLFGQLLSETETGATTKISDTAFINTVHKVEMKYRVGISFPEEDIPFKIINEVGDDFCFDGSTMSLNVSDEYSSCILKWELPKGISFYNCTDTQSSVKLKRTTDNYAYPIVCRAISCSGDTTYSDTIRIGKPTPTPEMEDLPCVAANETSFDVKVKEPDGQLSYHWSVEDLARGEIVDTQQGASVIMKVPQNDSVRLKLVSTGGCKASDTVTQVLHRSVVDGRNIYLQGDADCLFKGDTLRLLLQNAPHEDLVWKSGGGYDTLPWNKDFVIQGKNSVYRMSVFSKFCPDIVDSVTFNIREDFKVSLGSSPLCVSVRDSNVIRLISNGISPEVHWSGNGVVIDSITYSKKDSILMRLVKPGDPNLYVKVKAKECGRERDTLLVLRPRPEMPSLDTLWNALTPCIPLGIADTIELRVQPQEGVNFAWGWSENGKFQRITKVDSSSIFVATNFGLLDPEEDKTINVNVYAYTLGCTDSVAFPTTLYARGAGLDEEWKIGSKSQPIGSANMLTVGFYQKVETEIKTQRAELDSFAFSWNSSIAANVSTKSQALVFRNNKIFPFYVNCLLTNKNTSCYSYYSQTIEEVSTLQNIATSSSTEIAQNGTGNENVQGMSYAAPPQEEKYRGGFLLAPNPTHGNTLLYLERTMVDRRAVIEILTEQGVCLYRQKADADVAELPTASFRSGLYFVRVRVGDEDIVVRKLIVQQ
ncbi:MAG: T9SS type A sorting domain-containing protein [Bacteroides sp.]|nr:T9SS type A sorting domain-containing protein [Bacteroides sp.]MCM1086401.1 T9SS type A sorting domain-containing protein [Bacteroides sp.]MCM1169312.1 T9SS type A sorting domain-containing protein [Bacteroides sp.]